MFVRLCLLMLTFFSMIPVSFAEEVKFDQESIDHFLRMGKEGVLTAFDGTEEMNGTVLNLTYKPSANRFTGEFLIINKTNDVLDLRVIGLLNTKQVWFTFGAFSGNQHNIVVSQNEERRIPFSLENVPDGKNDLTILALDRVNPPSKYGVHLGNIFSHRIQLLRGGEEEKTFQYHKADCIPSKADTPYFLFPSLKKKYKATSTFKDFHFEKPKTSFYLHVSNPDEKMLNLGVFGFINGEQIRLKTEQSKENVIWQLKPKHISTIPIILEADTFKQGDDFMIVALENPGVDLETEKGEMAQVRSRIELIHRSEVTFK